jgi:hypothetical protein
MLRDARSKRVETEANANEVAMEVATQASEKAAQAAVRAEAAMKTAEAKEEAAKEAKKRAAKARLSRLCADLEAGCDAQDLQAAIEWGEESGLSGYKDPELLRVCGSTMYYFISFFI